MAVPPPPLSRANHLNRDTKGTEPSTVSVFHRGVRITGQYPTTECYLYFRSVSNGFLYASEAGFVTLELPVRLFICPDVIKQL